MPKSKLLCSGKLMSDATGFESFFASSCASVAVFGGVCWIPDDPPPGAAGVFLDFAKRDSKLNNSPAGTGSIDSLLICFKPCVAFGNANDKKLHLDFSGCASLRSTSTLVLPLCELARLTPFWAPLFQTHEFFSDSDCLEASCAKVLNPSSAINTVAL